jgi:NAD(P)-dependent dehydrogenase (short-subunit alcohol dehydrogenase family)
METAPFGIDVIVIEPGAIRTEWSGIASDGLTRRSGATAYAPYARRHAKLIDSAYASRLPSGPEVVARTIAKAVRAARPRTRYATGGGARIVLFLRRVLSDRTFDRIMWRAPQPFG